MDAFSVKNVVGQAVANIKIELLTDLVGFDEQIEELRQEWIALVLSSIGIEEDLLEDKSQADLFEFFIQSGIEISFYPSFKGTSITLDGDLIGEWGGPEFEVKFDEENNPYYKVTIEYWMQDEEEYDD